MILHLIQCGYCPTGQIIAVAYADAEKHGWRWSKRQGWRCPSCLEEKARLEAETHYSVSRRLRA